MISLEIDVYEAANLLWLLRVVRQLRVGLDTGDGLYQLLQKLALHEDDTWLSNMPNGQTSDLISQINAAYADAVTRLRFET